ncbi:MAG TPA: bifunctional phosphoribosyl-AMP cyclohydrolase/phosphoribosyl-ATP diphosphatase HisIE [Candidatus Dormibacteraeota bacterium]|nr:bifunctional phosphoribosyl-AMP cyclohydrolase/phosphoribosyl-ATP diphosphatase HisIE [Candidatus Dormibacteraeota bacterium]
MKSPDPTALTFDEKGLIVAIAQDAATGTVLMVAYMDREALARTVQSGEAHFWSRSRQSPWHKGETSGNVMRVEAIQADCDGDALLLSVRPAGPACHTENRSCFAEPATLLDSLEATIHSRRVERPSDSYSATLFNGGRPAIIRKFGEEAVEVMVAADHEDEDALVHEVADLWFHSMLVLEERGVGAARVLSELAARSHRTA